jgi:DNA modification methylase
MNNMKIDLRLGDCLEVLKTIPDNSIDAVITDPPYGIGFMNKEWDNPQKHQELIEREKERSLKRFEEGKSPAKAGFSTGVQPGLPIGGAKEGKWFQDWCELWACECFRILKPGGHALSFSAPRTYHRMATAFEDSGFQIRDQIMWVFGSGFPKSHNIGKAIDKIEGNEREEHIITKGNSDWEGWGTALKPAHEPIVMARKPLSEKSIAENVLKHGTGGINIDGSRIGFVNDEDKQLAKPQGKITTGTKENVRFQYTDDKTRIELEDNQSELGRFPANIIFDEEAGQLLDEQSDKASRFFYCPKAAKKDRNEGMPEEIGIFHQRPRREDGSVIYKEKNPEEWTEAMSKLPRKDKTSKAAAEEKLQDNTNGLKNNHPTVKPTDLMRYLINLITPPNGTILDPFMGSGSTGKAAVRCGVNFIGIEKEQEYMDIASARIEHERNKPTQQNLF